MSLKDCLYRICLKEAEIYKLESKISHDKSEMERYIEKSKKITNEYNKQLEECKEEYNKLSKEVENTKPIFSNNEVTMLIIWIVSSLVFVGFQFLMAFICNSLDATSIIALTLIPTIIVSIIIILIGLGAEECGIGIFCGIVFGILNYFLLWGYYTLCEKIEWDAIYSVKMFSLVLSLILGIILSIIYAIQSHMEDIAAENMEKELDCKKTQMKEKEVGYHKVLATRQAFCNKSANQLKIIEQYIANESKKLEQLKVEVNNMYLPVLHQNYRYWTAAATIYEYLDTGKCYQLQGPDGAYKLYDHELYMKAIVDSVNEVNRKIHNSFSSIHSSQRFISSQLSDCYREIKKFEAWTYENMLKSK